MGFNAMMTDTLSVTRKGDLIRQGIQGRVDPSNSLIFVPDASVSIQEGDVLQRTLPNGSIENYEVVDVGFQRGAGGIPDHYQSRVRKITQKPGNSRQPASLLVTPSNDQRAIIERVADFVLKEDEAISGKRLRSLLRVVLANAGSLIDSCIPIFLRKIGDGSDDKYEATLNGLLVSSQTALVSRVIESIIHYLKRRFQDDPDFSEYTLAQLRAAIPDVATVDARTIHRIICAGGLQSGGVHSIDDFRCFTPRHIERIAQWNEFSDVLREEVRTSEAGTAPDAVSSERSRPRKAKRVFETAFHSYQETRVVGEGAVGIVLEVQSEDKQPYALKLMRQELAESARAKRFANEVGFCADGRHKNIIRVIDVGFVQEGQAKVPYYVMKLYKQTLRKIMRDGLAPSMALSIFRQLLDGIEFAHGLSVWHRDIKPENILVDGDGSVVIADFGIAHYCDAVRETTVETEPGDRLANFEYAAPEQRRKGERVGESADVYALGLILNEMFTGSVPHGSRYRTIASAFADQAKLDGLVDRMIRQDPAERASLAEVRRLLGPG